MLVPPSLLLCRLLGLGLLRLLPRVVGLPSMTRLGPNIIFTIEAQGVFGTIGGKVISVIGVPVGDPAAL